MKSKRNLIFMLLVIITLIVYLYYENNVMMVTSYEIINKRIEKEFDNFKIVQISDYHNTKSKLLNNTLLKEIKSIKPDIIVITGDFIDSNRTDVNTSITLIEKIKDIAPIYYVTGNHEESVRSSYLKLKYEMELLGVKVLENEVEVIEKNEAKINIIGINDTDTITRFNSKISNIKYDKNYYSILLSHRPEHFTTYTQTDIDLILTGHAHGGQIRIPLIGGLIAPNQGFFPKYTSGEFNKDNKTMIVSRGLGNSILPFRINNRPELVVITLKNG